MSVFFGVYVVDQLEFAPIANVVPPSTWLPLPLLSIMRQFVPVVSGIVVVLLTVNVTVPFALHVPLAERLIPVVLPLIFGVPVDVLVALAALVAVEV